MTASTDEAWGEWTADTVKENAGEEPEVPEAAASALVGEVLTESPDVSPDTVITGPIPLSTAFPAVAEAVMLKDMRSWAWWLVGLGALHLFTAGVNGIGWAGLLFMVAIGSFIFKDAVIYVLYTVTLAWAGISNLVSGQSGWMFFSFLQFYIAYQTFRSYKRFQKFQDGIARSQMAEITSAERAWFVAPKVFPWLGHRLTGRTCVGIRRLVGRRLDGHAGTVRYAVYPGHGYRCKRCCYGDGGKSGSATRPLSL